MTPTDAAARFFRGRHAMVSFAYAQGRSQLPILAEICQSFALDNGAFTAWKRGEPVTDWNAFYQWVEEWALHPGFDWALIPDVIDGDEDANDWLIDEWPFAESSGVPVWHLHESIGRLQRLCASWQRVALGSSGEFADVGSRRWWQRMSEALGLVCREDGFPPTKLHGLRMLNPAIFAAVPLSSADSTNVAKNMGLDNRWTGPYVPISPDIRALVIADRIEGQVAASRWDKTIGIHQQDSLGLFA